MMSKPYLAWICIALLVFSSSCEKYPGNPPVFPRTPYVLYAGGLLGSLHQTNDAEAFKQLHPYDDVTIRQIITADTNILYLKKNCYVSDDDGRAFNVSNTNALPYYDVPLYQKLFMPHQMVYDKSQKRVYLCVNGGLDQSDDLGKTFINSASGNSPVSVVELDNDNVYAIQDDASIVVRNGGVGAWSPVAAGGSPLTAGTAYYLTSFGNTLVATDFEGTKGCFYSTNGGADWTKYGGVSADGSLILFVNAVDNNQGGKDLFLGRDGKGLFKLDPVAGSFEASSVGIPFDAKIYYVESKKLVFKTGVERFFYFCATDKGLYLSEEDAGGTDWRLIKEGSYSTLQ